MVPRGQDGHPGGLVSSASGGTRLEDALGQCPVA
jgi:hypothetical protein